MGAGWGLGLLWTRFSRALSGCSRMHPTAPDSKPNGIAIYIYIVNKYIYRERERTLIFLQYIYRPAIVSPEFKGLGSQVIDRRPQISRAQIDPPIS